MPWPRSDGRLGREQRLLYVERIAAASQLWSSNLLPLAEPLLDDCPPRFRHHWEWKFLNAFRRPYLNSIPHEEMVTSLVYDPRQRYLASATASGAVKLWDAASGRPLPPCTVHHGNFVTSLTFSPDGRQLATADRGDVKVWDVSTGRLMFSLTGSFFGQSSARTADSSPQPLAEMSRSGMHKPDRNCTFS